MQYAADLLANYRVFPRIFSIYYLYLTTEVWQWFQVLEVPTTEQAAAFSVMMTTAAAWFKFYVDGGSK